MTYGVRRSHCRSEKQVPILQVPSMDVAISRINSQTALLLEEKNGSYADLYVHAVLGTLLIDS